MFEKHFSKILGFLIFLTFDLMLLGAAVRALDAGLTCPDWPMCFGRAVPEYHLGVYLEFIHRVVAGVLALIFMGCYVFIFTTARFKHLRWTMTISLLLLMAQIIMGGLTVLQLLKPGIVTLHLGLATAFLISLVYAESQVQEASSDVSSSSSPNEQLSRYKLAAFIGLALICVQILLGGWVATNYAGAVCVDFPTCNGLMFPAWKGPIGAQVIHRMGAYTVALFYIFFFIYSFQLSKKQIIQKKEQIVSAKMFMLVLSQIMVGVLNLKLLVPPWLTVIHLGLAVYLMMTMLKLNLRLHKA